MPVSSDELNVRSIFGMRLLVARTLTRELAFFPLDTHPSDPTSPALLFSLTAAALLYRSSDRIEVLPDAVSKWLAHFHERLREGSLPPRTTRLIEAANWSVQLAQVGAGYPKSASEALAALSGLYTPPPTRSPGIWASDRLGLMDADLAIARDTGEAAIRHARLIPEPTLSYAQRRIVFEDLLRRSPNSWEPWLRWLEWRHSGLSMPAHDEDLFVHCPILLFDKSVREVNQAILSGLQATNRGLPTAIPVMPTLPPQENAPYFAVREDGIIDLALGSDLDAAGNNVTVLRQLQPRIVAIVKELVASLALGNAPHAALLARAQSYLKSVDIPLEEVAFGEVFVEGVRLQNAASAAKAAIGRADLPAFSPASEELLETLLTLNGAFVTSSSDGAALLVAEERYQRDAREELEYRTAAIELADELLKHPEAVDPRAAMFIRNAASEMGAGDNLSRSAVVSKTVVRNGIITLSGVAIILAAPIAVGAAIGAGGGAAIGAAVTSVVAWPLNEALKHTKAVKAVNTMLAQGFDQFTEETIPGLLSQGRRVVGAQLSALLSVAPILKRLSRVSRSLSWLEGTVDWLTKANAERIAETQVQNTTTARANPNNL